MVHRPADSRLLANLIAHEKDYSKHFHALFPISHTALASLSAYASASPSTPAHALASLVDILAGVDDALERYTSAVDKWRDELTALKDLEDEVGDVLRDREILVTRLIKASKTPKRESRPTFSMRNSETDSFSSVPSTASSNTKLSHAQAELSACEAHLAAKEQELEARRISAVRDGLGHRCRALIDCGWVMGEMGKDGLRALEALGGSSNGHAPDGSATFPSGSPPPNATEFPSKPGLPYLSPIPTHLQTGVGSDISSLTPSQSASQIFVRGSEDSHPGHSSSVQEHHDQDEGDVTLNIPPAHSMSELDLPTGIRSPARAMSPLAMPNGNGNGSTASLPVQRRPTQNGGKRQRRPLSRRITEESGEDEDNVIAAGGSYIPRARETSSSDDEAQGPLQVVDNAPFAQGAAGSGSGHSKRFTLRHAVGSTPDVASSGQAHDKEKKGGFFGSIKGLFGKKDKRESQRVASAQQVFSDWETATEPPAPASRAKPGKGRWATRTDANLKSSRGRGGSSDEEELGPSGTVKRRGKAPAGAGGKLKKGGGRASSPPVDKFGGGGGAAGAPAPNAGWASEGGGDGEATIRRKKSTASASARRRAISHQAGTPSKASAANGWSAPGHARAKSQDVVVVEPEVVTLSRSATTASTTPTKKPGASPMRKQESEAPLLSNGGVGASVSRNSSVSKGSIMSAPATLNTGAATKKARRVTVDGETFTQAGAGTISVLSTSASVPGSKPPAEDHDATPRRSNSTRSNASAATNPTASDFKAKNRAQKAKTMPPPPKSNGAASLMSIVEDVSRQNRAGWAHAKDARDDAGEGNGVLGSTAKNLSTYSLVARRNSTGAKPDGLPGASLLEVPKAPSLTTPVVTAPVMRVTSSDGDVVRTPGARSASYDLPRPSSTVASSLPQKSKTHDWLSPTDTWGDGPGVTRVGSVNSGTSSGSGSGTGTGSGTSRPAVSPLKSALRNSSRTPSPAPVPPASPSSSAPAASAPAAATPSPTNSAEIQTSVKTQQSQPKPASKREEKPRGRTPEREAPPPIKIPQAKTQNDAPAQARPQARPAAQVQTLQSYSSRRSSVTSVSSYETVNEEFASADEGSSPVEGGVNGYAVPEPESGTPPPPPHDHDPIGDGASSVSTEVAHPARASTPPSAPAPPPPAKEPVVAAEPDGTETQNAKPVRRKSVRVSLQPTFSPTPPALDEDDEEHEGRWAPWDDRSGSRSQGTGNGSAKGGEADVWADSSDEDEEYRKARRLLMRVGRKEREKGKGRA